MAYETYGDKANAEWNTVLLLHGYTSNPHAAGGGDSNPGWWENLIGPGRAIDTDRYFVVTPNMLGSSYGTTGPRSINPDTGKPYGPAFPEITTRDMIEAHCRLQNSARESSPPLSAILWRIPDLPMGCNLSRSNALLTAVATGITGRGDESTVHD